MRMPMSMNYPAGSGSVCGLPWPWHRKPVFCCWMVMTGAASPAVILGTILAMAVVQVLVHLVCFLHMNTKSDEGWNMTAFVFTVLIIAILVVGSIWIMWNLNYNMMMH